MRLSTLTLLAAAAVSSLATPTHANVRTVSGPFVDLDLPIPVGYVNNTNPTAVGPWLTPPNPPYIWTNLPVNQFSYQNIINDSVAVNHHIIIDSPFRVAGTGYFVDNGNEAADGIDFVTIYGVNVGTDGGPLTITGFDPTNPQLDFSDEKVIGHEGIIYLSSSNRILPLGSLAATLGPDFDLSAFQGDPNSLVYVFDTPIPLAVAVPEPATALLLLPATLLAASRLRSRRQT
ncbi:MAG TPA: hypothetical protein VFE58_14380 [Tepidisphaeraceae bacterium]|jgi:hypothetical protein|nr:hypothetical protein [Tepidisphaeraceae bacterium]